MKTYAILLFLFLAVSCKKDELDRDPTGAVKASVCGVNYPMRELPWLRKIIEDAKVKKEENLVTIKLFEVNGKPIFNYDSGYMSCIGCISFYCDGSPVDITKWTVAEMKEYQSKVIAGTGKIATIWPEK
ncbi:hypothetical protein [Dyadobacter sp. LHD-138]|uniref:hypothetical protein n=1 Tax=Dyadobacter sp. LHD-138 TaxID=3071413 RepID=UPI0027E1BD66|nr:hypothetical protein [Dyadobacter sp. LHD-138]MDQ6480777.1 hypothetical protein [Dyadobacter sp. LHD-138]